MMMNADDLDWSDDEEDYMDDVQDAFTRSVPAEYIEIDSAIVKSNYFSGSIKIKSNEIHSLGSKTLTLKNMMSSSKLLTSQNTATSGLSYDDSPNASRTYTRQNTSASGLSYDDSPSASRTYTRQSTATNLTRGSFFRSETSSNNLQNKGLVRQTTFGSVVSTAASTALPPAVLRFYGEDIVTEMWQIVLSLQAVDDVSGLVKISSIRDLAKWLRHVKKNGEKKIVVDDKSLLKELNRWDSDDWINFAEVLQIIQRHSSVESIAILQAPTATKGAANAKVLFQKQTIDAQLLNKTFQKPILLNRCCAHAACRNVCAYAYSNTTQGNLGHHGGTSIATADGVFNLDFIAPLFDKRRQKINDSSSTDDESLRILQIVDRPNDDSESNVEENVINKDDNSDGNEDNTDEDVFSRKELFRLNVAFSRVVVKRPGGRLRVEDLLEVMQEAGIKYDMSKVAIESWEVAKNLLVDSFDALLAIMKRLRMDEELITGPLAHLIKYPVPLWLQQEFSQAELLLYQHHFMLIDIDGGGTIDANELQQLLNSFCADGAPGTYRVSQSEATDIVNMFDLDGGGTLDFVEFLVLIYRLQRGTMSKEFLRSPAGSLLVTALTEAKRQLHLFEEIEEVGLHPPKGCSILSFGGSPVLCTVAIQVQPETTVAKGSIPASLFVPFFITVHVTLHDGYPYRPPEVHIKEPGIVHPLCIRALDGSCRLMHLPRLWQGLDRLADEERADAQIPLKDDLFVNNLESLLRHIHNLLNQPSKLWTRARCVEWLIPELREIYQSWQWKIDSREDTSDENENSPVEKPSKLLSVEELSDPSILAKFRKLSRLHQMHLGTLLIHVQDIMQYRILANSIVQFKRVLEG